MIIWSGVELSYVRISSSNYILVPILVAFLTPEYTWMSLSTVIFTLSYLYPYIKVGVVSYSC